MALEARSLKGGAMSHVSKNVLVAFSTISSRWMIAVPPLRVHRKYPCRSATALQACLRSKIKYLTIIARLN
jgi:hypothetical protein